MNNVVSRKFMHINSISTKSHIYIIEFQVTTVKFNAIFQEHARYKFWIL